MTRLPIPGGELEAAVSGDFVEQGLKGNSVIDSFALLDLAPVFERLIVEEDG